MGLRQVEQGGCCTFSFAKFVCYMFLMIFIKFFGGPPPFVALHFEKIFKYDTNLAKNDEKSYSTCTFNPFLHGISITPKPRFRVPDPSLNIISEQIIIVCRKKFFWRKKKSHKILNWFSAKAQYEILRHSSKQTLIGPPPPVTMLRDHYTREVKQIRDARRDYQAYPSFYPDLN